MPLAPARSLSANEWLRIGLIGAVMAGILASVFGYVVAEPLLGRAVKLEAGGHAHMTMTPEVFTRGEQQAGFVLGELVFACGVGFLLAGAAFLLSRADGRPARLWVGMTAACVWAAVVLPAFAFPPLPPGVESTLSVGWRQSGYVLIVATGLLGAALACRAWRAMVGLRRVSVALLCIVAPGAAVIATLPKSGTEGSPPAALLRDFRMGSWGTQAVFWLAFLLVGWYLLRRRGTSAEQQDPSGTNA